MSALKTLIPETRQVLEKLAVLELLNNFTFVGGSALSLYLGHRYSEDIDLFTWHPELDLPRLQHQIEKAGFTNVKTVNFSKTEADFLIDDVKVTFFANDWAELKNRKLLQDQLFIAELAILAVMKVNTLFLRATYRDYYDLYVLNLHHFTVAELYEMTASKMTNLTKTLFQRALVFTKDIEDENIDHLQPTYNVTLQEIEDHFYKKIEAWNESLK